MALKSNPKRLPRCNPPFDKSASNGPPDCFVHVSPMPLFAAARASMRLAH